MDSDADLRQRLLENPRGNGAEKLSDSTLYYDSFPRNLSSPEQSYTSSINASEGDYKGPPEENESGETFKVYKRRWYVMIIFSLFCMTQNGLWNTWAPISITSKDAFGWDTATISWMNNWGPIAYILTGLFFPWLLQVKGLRWAVLSSSLLMAAGTSLRVITSEPPAATILIHIGQFLNGVAGPMAMGAVPTLSSVWFPPKQRVTATAISTSISVSGIAITFVGGPALVSGGPPEGNATSLIDGVWSLDTAFPNSTAARISKERQEIMRYMYYSCGWAWLVTLCILFYFPNKPPNPPCVSAVMKRDNYWSGIWSLRKKGYFLIIAFTYGVSVGVVNVWASVLTVNLQSIHISEVTSGWIGFYATLAGCVCATLVGRFAEYFNRRMKFFIIVMYCMGTASLIVFTLMLIGIIPYSAVLLYSTVILTLSLVNGAVPVLMELACELAYPTSEGAANGVITYLNNIGGLIFLAVFFFPNVGTMWMNWTTIGTTFLCVPFVALLRGRFKRLEVDESIMPEDSLAQEVIVPTA